MKKLCLIALLLTASSATAQSRPSVERLMTDQKGYLTCTAGGTSSPLFTRECAKLTLSRVASAGSTKYEGTCKDGGDKVFYLVCDGIVFEYSELTEHSKIPTLR